MSNSTLRYAAPRAAKPKYTPLVSLFRTLILLGVWVLVGLAGLLVWAKLRA